MSTYYKENLSELSNRLQHSPLWLRVGPAGWENLWALWWEVCINAENHYVESVVKEWANHAATR